MGVRRRYAKGQSHAVMRRMLRQLRRLAPSAEVNALLRYVLLLHCSRKAKDLEVTAYCALSNHHHLVVTDRRGGEKSRVSDFFRDLHALLALALNTMQGCSGVAWDPGTSFSNVEIHGFQAEVAQWVYVAGQAVAAGLVEQPEDWPGVCWLPEDIGRTLTAERPKFFYSTRERDEEEVQREVDLRKKSQRDKKRGRTRRRRRQLGKERRRRAEAKSKSQQAAESRLPKFVSYTVPVPKFLREVGMDAPQAREFLREALDTYIARLHQDRREQGLGFLGPEALRDQDPLTPPPRTHVANDYLATYRHVPRLATQGLGEETVRELKSELYQWHADYDAALDLLRSQTPHRARFPKGAHLRAREERRVRRAYAAQAPPRAA